MIAPRLLPHRLKLPHAFTQVAIHNLPVRHVESERSENLFESQRRERFSNSLGRLSPEECVYHGVQGNARPCNVVRPVALFNVFLGHGYTISVYAKLRLCSPGPISLTLRVIRMPESTR